MTVPIDLSKNECVFRVGIAGCGRIAEHHLKFLAGSKNVLIAGMADPNTDQALKLGEKYGIRNVFASVDELVQSAEIDVIHILTPPKHHFEIASMAIERGIHCLIEKPLALSFEETTRLYGMAEEKRVKICPNFIHLFNPLVRKAKEAIRKNNLDRLLYAESYLSINLDDPQLRETAGLHWSFDLPLGVMQNNITHPLYLLLDWIGKPENITVYPRQFGKLPQELTDHLDIMLKGSAANGHITVTVAPSHENYYVKLFFEGGTVLIDFMTQTFIIEKCNSLPRTVNRVLVNFEKSRQLTGRTVKNIVDFIGKKLVPYHGLKYLIEDFYLWIDGRGEAPVTKDLALDVSHAEDDIAKQAGRVRFETVTRQPTQTVTRKERVLVTGGTGYLGGEIVRRLVKSGYYVRAYVRRTSHTDLLEKMGVELFYGDIRQAGLLGEAARGMDIVIHIAAALRGSSSYVMSCSVDGTRNIANAATENGIKRVVYMSSFSVYDYYSLKNGSVLVEDSPLEPEGVQRGVYSCAKRLAEDIALSQISGDGPAWTILRPSMLFGNKHDLTSLIGPRIGNVVLSFGRRTKHVKLIHVRDAAEAVLRTVETEAAENRIFNISHQDEMTVDDFVKACQAHNNGRSKLRVIYIPYKTGLAAAVLLRFIRKTAGRGPAMNKVRLAYLCRDVLADTSAFYRAVGWRPEERLLEQLTNEIAVSGDNEGRP